MKKIIEVEINEVGGTSDFNVMFKDGYTSYSVPGTAIKASEVKAGGLKQVLKLKEAGFSADEILEMRKEGLI